MQRIAPWNVVHTCSLCNEGWICEEHPDLGWPHDDCAGPGMPCAGLLAETAQWEREAVERLGPLETEKD